MSSLVERLRTRSKKRPLYNDVESDDDFVPSKKKSRPRTEEKLTRLVAAQGACRACGESGSLLDCSTCTFSFHQQCLIFYRKSSTNNWSCPECVNPLNEVCKILDSKICATAAADEHDLSRPRTKNVGTRHYLVKWKGLSHLHCTWVPEEELKKACKVNSTLKSRLNYFKKQLDSMIATDDDDDDWIAMRPEWTTVDRIIGSRKTSDEREYFVKWKELPYDECSWEFESDISTFRPQIERFKEIQSRSGRSRNKNLNHDSKNAKSRLNKFQHFGKSPKYLSGGTLHPFQLEGLNFLRFSWLKNTHVILADEMGLGKTIQSIAFLASLFEENLYPHLVVAPLSTLRNWEREFSTWAPQLNVVMYFGSAQARSIIRQYEFFYPYTETKKHKKKAVQDGSQKKQAKRIKFDVLLTSYEMINMDSSSLKFINWECMIVDEGHRLKNNKSKLFIQLKLFASNHRVLLTGTPLQNNLDELFMLMHYLDDGKFSNIEDFQEEFKDINQGEQIARLHKMLAPHLLRRVKKDVMKDLPPKKELILRVDLSSKQKEYYKAILTRNYQILARHGGSQISLINVVMELRKLCCHVYMLKGVDPDTTVNASENLRQLLDLSRKMQLLDKMLVRLKEQGHRVLIYSQFQHMLDLLEDYLSYRKWSYERIDGSISGAERQVRIDRFNAKDSTRFCFVLSTRAGGLGINLATADTVIIYDSDWNPHADLQAMARAHRLGQTNKVMIYRLITRGTIEERMMQMTKKKMILEHLVVGRLKARTVNQEELDDIIRYGSKELFADECDEAGKARQIHYDDAAVDRLLNRDDISVDEASIEDEEDDLLKAFKVANFEFIDEVEAAAAREEEAKKKSMDEKHSTSKPDRFNYWKELLGDKYDVIQIEESLNMGKGKRNRKQMPVAEEDVPSASSSVDDDSSYEDEFSDTDIEVSEQASRKKGPLSGKRSRVDLSESHALMEGEGRSLRVRGFNQSQRAAFLQVLMRFGFGKYDWKEFMPRLKGKSMQEVHDYGCLFMEHLIEGFNDSPTFLDGVPKEGVQVDDVLVRLGLIQSIKEKLDVLLENPSALLFPDDIQTCFPSFKGRFWRQEHDVSLLKAILKHGYARWQTIVEDNDAGLAEIVRHELNLPEINGPVVGGVNQTTVKANSGFMENVFSEAPASNPMLYHFREIQRRIIDYIRKRYYLLEKVMNMELAKEKACGGKTSELIQDSDVDSMVTEVLGPKPADTSTFYKESPTIETIALQGHDIDDKSGCHDIIRLYNEMCKLVEANTLDALQAYCGHISVSSRLSKNLCQLQTICKGVLQVLLAPDSSFSMEGLGDAEKC